MFVLEDLLEEDLLLLEDDLDFFSGGGPGGGAGGLAFAECVLSGTFIGSTFSFDNVNLDSISGWVFNPNNPYSVQARISGQPVWSNYVDLIYDNCVLALLFSSLNTSLCTRSDKITT